MREIKKKAITARSKFVICANSITLYREIYGNNWLRLLIEMDTQQRCVPRSTENLTINISFLTTFMRGGTSFSTYASSITQCCKIFFKNKYFYILIIILVCDSVVCVRELQLYTNILKKISLFPLLRTLSTISSVLDRSA